MSFQPGVVFMPRADLPDNETVQVATHSSSDESRLRLAALPKVLSLIEVTLSSSSDLSYTAEWRHLALNPVFGQFFWLTGNGEFSTWDESF